MDIRDLPLDDLVLDPNLNLRDRLDDFSVERYADSWDRLPPITVFEVDGRWLIADGFHRHAAAIMLGKHKVPAEIRTGTFAEALDFVASVNLFHGLPLTRAERRRAVEVKLKLHHDWSDRRMAEELSVSRDLVAKVRRQLAEGGQIPHSLERIGADGKVYSAGLPKDANERLPTGKPIAQEDEPKEREPGRRGGFDDSGGRVSASPQPAAAATGSMSNGSVPPWEDAGDFKKSALSPPINSATPTIDEMLELMSQQIQEIVNWTNADGFMDAYRAATQAARNVFQSSVLKLASRVDQLHG